MPLNFQNLRSRIVVAKAAVIADWDTMEASVGTWTFDAAEGVEAAAGVSNRVTILVGGFADCKITANLKTDTAAGSESFGALARFVTNETGYATYYYARQQQGNFRIQKVVDGTFTTLATVANTIIAGTFYSFVLRVVGTALTASIDAVELTATDSAIAGPGAFGFRSGPTQSTQISCKSWQVEEV